MRIQVETSGAALLINDRKPEAFEASCGRASREDWNTVSDPDAGSLEVIEKPPRRDSRAVSEEPPRRTQPHLVVLSQKPRNGAGEVQVMPGLWTIWSTPLFRMTPKNQYRQCPRTFTAKTVSFNLRPTQEQSSTTSGSSPERLADAHSSATSSSRTRETRLNAGGSTKRCGRERQICQALHHQSPEP